MIPNLAIVPEVIKRLNACDRCGKAINKDMAVVRGPQRFHLWCAIKQAADEGA